MEYKINVEDNGNVSFEKVKGLLKEINYWLDFATTNEMKDEILNSKIQLNLYDIDGQVISGDLVLSVGYCNERFVLYGNVQKVIE